MEIVNAAVELALLRADPLSPDEARRVSNIPTGLPRRTRSTVSVVGLQQPYLRVPIRTAVKSVSFHEDGDEVTSEPYPVSASVSTQPTTSVVEAAHAACL